MKDWAKSNLNMINRSNLSLLSLMRLFKPTGVDQILVGIYINLCMKQINVRCQNIFKRQFLIRGRGKKLRTNVDSSMLSQRNRKSRNKRNCSQIDSSIKF